MASTADALSRGDGDLWDSDTVASDQSIHVVYEGAPLRSRQPCWWSVRIGDRDGRTSAWSRPAFWEMGLLDADDWEARWIGLAQSWAGEAAWPQARWIWAAPNTGADGRPGRAETNRVPAVTLRRSFVLPPERQVARAILRLTADDYFALHVNGVPVGHNAGKPYSAAFLQEYDIRRQLRAGENRLWIVATNRQGCAGVLGQLAIEFSQGPPLTVATDGSWEAAATEGVWAAATELARPGEAPWDASNYPPMQPCPLLRKAVTFPRRVRRARLYATALGVYEFHINGKRVGEDLFNPGWTDYHQRVQYHVYDVTSLLRRGDNALGIVLGDGWYAGFVGLAGRCRYGEQPLAMAQLEVELADGSQQTIVTDGSWKAATGPLRHSDLLMGECYDARLERPGWNRPGFDDTAWQPASVVSKHVRRVAAPDAPVRKTRELRPVSVAEPKPGRFVFDLGQNLVGRVRLKARGRAGDEITLRFGEMTHPDGTLYVENLREARCTDTYVLRGGGTEVYEPRFTFHGFRYVELTGCRGRPGRDAITALVLHSDMPIAGVFECSNPLVNRLQANILWGQRGNFLSIPTDCPQRDERLGWTGDAQVFLRTATYQMDVAAFFTKWCQDVADAQRPDGAFTDVAPFVAAASGTAAWGDAGVLCPWTLYRVYGDRQLLERHYAAGQRWIAYLSNHSTNGLRPATRYGDWLSIDADTPLDLLATAYFAHSAETMARIADVLNEPEAARRYQDLFRRIRAAFNAAYVGPDGRIRGNTQTAYLMALEFDLLPPETRPRAVQHLVADLRARGDRLSTGFIGVGLLLPVLTRAGHVDLAYRLLTQDAFPSWLHSVKQGATTIWERWDGWTRERGFQTPWMNSFNHYSLGSVGRWLYESVAGIGMAEERPAFKRIVIRPHPGGGLRWARAEYQSMHGLISSRWEIRRGRFRLTVATPPNTRAAVHVPAGRLEAVRENGKPVRIGNGIREMSYEDGHAVFEVGSGRYEFSAPALP
ncbi:MAG: family 78 glycoside hydrolase catalytic domain [Verrucomicrobia bacterium]|nr:family 78 glycoside hydrolase catalytic domain [Verrucomicrobiota bacterium]